MALAYFAHFAIRQFHRVRKLRRTITFFKETLERHREVMAEAERDFRGFKDEKEKLDAQGPAADQGWKREVEGHLKDLAHEIRDTIQRDAELERTIARMEAMIVGI